MSNKKNPPQEYEVTLRVKVTVSNFSEEDKVLPTLPQVMEDWESYTGGEILGYKELAESVGSEHMDRKIEINLISWSQAPKPDVGPISY